MINILLDCPNMQDFYEPLKECFQPTDRVTVIPFSFYDNDVTDAESFDSVYGKGRGRCYYETVDSFIPWGIPEENFTFVNYFTDTPERAAEKVKNADVIYFTGGLPDRMMDRICEFGLCDVLMQHRGVVVGYSAGAVIQMEEYHLSPDADYASFGYYRGLPYLNGFGIEVHYEHREEQKRSIARVLRERERPVYVTHTAKGGVLVKNGEIIPFGTVDLYLPNEKKAIL